MDPFQVAAIMQGKIPYKSNKGIHEPSSMESPLQTNLDKQIDVYVDKMELEEEVTHTGLLPAKVKRDKLKLEMKEAAKLPKLAQQIETAMALLRPEGQRHLDEKDFQKLESDLSSLWSNLEKVTLNDLEKYDMQHLTGMSQDTMQSIELIALSLFSEEHFSDCLALFALLTNLNALNAEYWFRLGIAAQKCADVELASRAYKATCEIDPQHIGARMLGAECYIQSRLLDEAKAELTAAKEMISKENVEAIWLELLPILEEMLAHAQKSGSS